jgi:hypothetical protein
MAAKKPIYMESTGISADRTAVEISCCLVQAGATSISTRYDQGKIVGLDWIMTMRGSEVRFSMPARTAPIYKLLINRRARSWSTRVQEQTREQAERVAWRQLLRWVQAQMAMIDTGMVKAAEVFMPYMMHADGSTFFEYFESKQLSLPASPETNQS